MQQQFQCPRCGAPVAFGVGFCGNCGTQLNWSTQPPPPPKYQQQASYNHQSTAIISDSQGSPVSLAKTIEDELIAPFVSAFQMFLRRPWSLKVEFIESSSKALPQLLKLAKTMRGFSEDKDENGNALYQVTFEPLEIRDFERLYKSIKSWKGTLIHINDEIVSQKDVSKWLICYRDKVAFLKSNPLFCWGASTFTANIFGCHRTKVRDSDWSWNGCWYSIGELDKTGIFHTDKKRIVALIIDNLQPYYICPALNPVHIMLGLKIIPDIIDPRKDERWEYVTLSGGKPIGVKPATTITFGQGYTVPMSPQFRDLITLLEHKLKMGTITLI